MPHGGTQPGTRRCNQPGEGGLLAAAIAVFHGIVDGAQFDRLAQIQQVVDIDLVFRGNQARREENLIHIGLFPRVYPLGEPALKKSVTFPFSGVKFPRLF